MIWLYVFLNASKIFIAVLACTTSMSATAAPSEYQKKLYERAYSEATTMQQQKNDQLKREIDIKRKELALVKARKQEEERQKEFSKVKNISNPFSNR